MSEVETNAGVFEGWLSSTRSQCSISVSEGGLEPPPG